MHTIRILGCGNPLVGDDGIGIHILERLKEMNSEIPDDVELLDAGVCGLDILNMLEGASHIIIVDAVEGAGNAGSIHRFGLDDIRGATSKSLVSIHETCLADVLCIAEQIQEMPEKLVIFGVEIDKSEELSLQLSDKIQNSADELVKLILDELHSMKAS